MKSRGHCSGGDSPPRNGAAKPPLSPLTKKNTKAKLKKITRAVKKKRDEKLDKLAKKMKSVSSKLKKEKILEKKTTGQNKTKVSNKTLSKESRRSSPSPTNSLETEITVKIPPKAKKSTNEAKSPVRKPASPKKRKVADSSTSNSEKIEDKSNNDESVIKEDKNECDSPVKKKKKVDGSPKVEDKLKTDLDSKKKRGRPKGSKNKLKDPNDPKLKSPVKKEKKTMDVKPESEAGTEDIKKEQETSDPFAYRSDDTASEYEDLNAKRKAKKDKKSLSNKTDGKVKTSLSPKSDLSSGWETTSELENSLKSVKKSKETAANVKSVIDSVLSRFKGDTDGVTAVKPKKAKSPKKCTSETTKKTPQKSAAKSPTRKVDFSADDEESEDENPKPKKTKAKDSVKVSPKKQSLKRSSNKKTIGKTLKDSKPVKRSSKYISDDEESHKDSDSEEEAVNKTEKKKKRITKLATAKPKKKEVERAPSPLRRTARMASLNARAVMVCMNEDARMPLHSSPKKEPKKQPPAAKPDLSLVLRHDSTIAKRHTDDSEDDSDDDSVEIRRFDCKKKNDKVSKTKKIRKKRRGELDIQMDMRDMVVTKRMASLNASAIMAAISIESRKRTPINHTASSSAESEVTNLNIKRKISYKSKGNKSRSVITVQETTKKLKKAEGTRQTEVEERIIVKKKVKRHSAKNTDTDREDEDNNTDVSEMNHDVGTPKSPDDAGIIVESTITYISTQTDTSPHTASVSGVSSYSISSGEGKTTTVVQQVERKSKTTTKCSANSTFVPPTACIPPTHIQPICQSSASPVGQKSSMTYSPLGALSGMHPLEQITPTSESYSPHSPTQHLHHHHHHIHSHMHPHTGGNQPYPIPPPNTAGNTSHPPPPSQSFTPHPPASPQYLQPHSPPYPPPPLPSPPMLMPPSSTPYTHHHQHHHQQVVPPHMMQQFHQGVTNGNSNFHQQQMMPQQLPPPLSSPYPSPHPTPNKLSGVGALQHPPYGPPMKQCPPPMMHPGGRQMYRTPGMRMPTHQTMNSYPDSYHQKCSPDGYQQKCAPDSRTQSAFSSAGVSGAPSDYQPVSGPIPSSSAPPFSSCTSTSSSFSTTYTSPSFSSPTHSSHSRSRLHSPPSSSNSSQFSGDAYAPPYHPYQSPQCYSYPKYYSSRAAPPYPPYSPYSSPPHDYSSFTPDYNSEGYSSKSALALPPPTSSSSTRWSTSSYPPFHQYAEFQDFADKSSDSRYMGQYRQGTEYYGPNHSSQQCPTDQSKSKSSRQAPSTSFCKQNEAKSYNISDSRTETPQKPVCQSPDSSSLRTQPCSSSSQDPLPSSDNAKESAKRSCASTTIESLQTNPAIAATIANLLKHNSCTITSVNVAPSSSSREDSKSPPSLESDEAKLSPQVPSINSTTNIPLGPCKSTSPSPSKTTRSESPHNITRKVASASSRALKSSSEIKRSIASALPHLSASMAGTDSINSSEETNEDSSDKPSTDQKVDAIISRANDADLSVANDLLFFSQSHLLSQSSFKNNSSNITVSSTNNLGNDTNQSAGNSSDDNHPQVSSASTSSTSSSTRSNSNSPNPRSRHLLCQIVPALSQSKTATARAKPQAIACQNRFPIKSEVPSEGLAASFSGITSDRLSPKENDVSPSTASNNDKITLQKKRGRPPKLKESSDASISPLDDKLHCESPKNVRGIDGAVSPQNSLAHQSKNLKKKSEEEKISSPKKLNLAKSDTKFNIPKIDLKKTAVPLKPDACLQKIKPEKVSPNSSFSLESFKFPDKELFQDVPEDQLEKLDEKFSPVESSIGNSKYNTESEHSEERDSDKLVDNSNRESSVNPPVKSTKGLKGNSSKTKVTKSNKNNKKSLEAKSRMKKSLLAYLKERNDNDSSNIDSDVPGPSNTQAVASLLDSPPEKTSDDVTMGPSNFPSSFTSKSLRKRLSLNPKNKMVKKPKWVHGWKWEGAPFQGKIWLRNDEVLMNRTCYSAMTHKEGDVVKVRDCVLLRSGPKKSDLPFVAKVAALWEDPDQGDMMMSILWYYRPEHTDMGRQDHDYVDELFASKHRDHLSVACIEDTCYVLTFNEYCRYRRHLRLSLQSLPPQQSMLVVPVPKGDNEYHRQSRQPPGCVVPEILFFCRKVYDYRQKRILKNPY